MLLSAGRRSVLTPRHLRGLAADLVQLVLAAVAGWSMLALGSRSGAVESLAGAAVLTAGCCWRWRHGRRRPAGAAGRRRARAARAGRAAATRRRRASDLWQLLGHLTLFGMAALLAAAAGWTGLGAARGRMLTLAASAAVLVAMASVAVTGALRPGWVPAASAVLLVGGLGWFGARPRRPC